MMHTTIENPFRKFWDLGYRTLLPVVPHDAEIAERTHLSAKSRGKSPGVRGRDGRWRGVNLHAVRAEEADLDEWFNWGAGVGMKGDEGLFFVDVDHMGAEEAKRLYKLATKHLGKSWPRVGQPPKFALPYRSTEMIPAAKIKFEGEAVAGKEPGLDIISSQPHCVVHGIHATTGQPYAWPKGVPPFEELTTVTPERVEAFLQAVAQEFPAKSHQTLKDREGAVDQESLRGDRALLRDAIESLPNSDRHFPDRQDYLSVGYALKAGFGPDHEDEALDLFLDWCARWDNETEVNDPEVAEADWRRMKGPYSVGADYLYSLAEDLAGWNGRAKTFFEPQEADTSLDMFMPPKEEAKPRRRIELLTDHDLQTRPDPKWLIDQHIPEDGLGILYGEPGAGKSFVALDMALHLAVLAETWHGDAINGADRGAVLYIAGEGAGDFKLRVSAWKKQNYLPDAYIPETRFRALLDPLDFRSEEDIKALIEAIKAIDMPRLSMVVIDTVARATPGADENSSQDIGLFVRACDAVRVLTGAFVLAVHHPNKSGGLRGSTALLGAADVVFRFERPKGQFYGRLSCEKMKAGPDTASEPYRLDVVDLGRGLSSLVPTRVEETEAQKSICTTEMQEQIMAEIEAAWMEAKPWSMAPQARDRYAPQIIASRYSVPAEAARQWLDLWLHGPDRVLEVSTLDSKRHVKGLRKRRDGSDDTSDEAGIFG